MGGVWIENLFCFKGCLYQTIYVNLLASRSVAAESVLLELAKAAIALVSLSNIRPGAAATAAATLVSKCFQTWSLGFQI